MRGIGVDYRCLPCFMRQVVYSLDGCGQISTEHSALVRELLQIIKEADFSRSPAHTTSKIHRKVREHLKTDPFSEKKKVSNKLALELLPLLEEILKASGDEIRTAVRLAIIGNVIDFGIFKDVDIKGEIERFLDKSFSVDDFEKFCTKVMQNDRILYILDNAGEIVFDRLLIGELIKRGKEVTAVVRGGPVLNDVTMSDAVDTGLLSLCNVVDNGSDCVGTVLEECSPNFVKTFYDFPFVISKGQANYETLIGSRIDMAFLFMAKCEVVAGHLGVPKNGMVLKVL